MTNYIEQTLEFEKNSTKDPEIQHLIDGLNVFLEEHVAAAAAYLQKGEYSRTEGFKTLVSIALEYWKMFKFFFITKLVLSNFGIQINGLAAGGIPDGRNKKIWVSLLKTETLNPVYPVNLALLSKEDVKETEDAIDYYMNVKERMDG